MALTPMEYAGGGIQRETLTGTTSSTTGRLDLGVNVSSGRAIIGIYTGASGYRADVFVDVSGNYLAQIYDVSGDTLKPMKSASINGYYYYIES